jgi:hypothetical protein
VSIFGSNPTSEFFHQRVAAVASRKPPHHRTELLGRAAVARGEPAHRSASALPQAVHGVKNLMGSGATGRPLWARYEIRSDQPAAICP